MFKSYQVSRIILLLQGAWLGLSGTWKEGGGGEGKVKVKAKMAWRAKGNLGIRLSAFDTHILH